MSNIVQHAQARRAQVTLSYEGTRIRLSVTDDGRGLEPGLLEDEGRPGQGIPNMQARARLLGGELTIESADGQGTEVMVVVPCSCREVNGPSEG